MTGLTRDVSPLRRPALHELLQLLRAALAHEDVDVALAVVEELLDQVATDETRCTGDEVAHSRNLPSHAVQAAIAGSVAVFVGFASSFTIVLAGLRAVGATQAQAASGLFALCVTMGVVTAVLSRRTRMPIAIAWSTPGAALLVATGPVDGGFAAAVGAFLVCGVLLALTGLSAGLGPADRPHPRPAGQRDARRGRLRAVPRAGARGGRPARAGGAGDRHVAGAQPLREAVGGAGGAGRSRSPRC